MGPKGFKVNYFYQGKMYTKKIKEDYNTIINSSFKEIYNFDGKKTDVFFLNYTFDGKKVMNVSKNLIKRIRLCEIMLNEDNEASSEKRVSPGTNRPMLTPPKPSSRTSKREKTEPPSGEFK
jgi:hypothetical protein